MGAILGIDAAWTSHHPSGVAVVKQTASGTWELGEVESSYGAFIRKSGMDFRLECAGTAAIPELLEAAKKIAGEDIVLVAVDMPLAKTPIIARRPADNRVSECFGGLGCGTHSPNVNRPGKIGEQIRDGFQNLGYRLATSRAELSDHSPIEVFPHPALLALMDVNYRFPYKVSKARRLWPDISRLDRPGKLKQQFDSILGRLELTIGGVTARSQLDGNLKQTEDKIDALICAWVGILTLRRETKPYGDADAAIWVPTASLVPTRPKTWTGLLRRPVASEFFMEGVDDPPPQERAIWKYD